MMLEEGEKEGRIRKKDERREKWGKELSIRKKIRVGKKRGKGEGGGSGIRGQNQGDEEME